jgi:hypothetical protein
MVPDFEIRITDQSIALCVCKRILFLCSYLAIHERDTLVSDCEIEVVATVFLIITSSSVLIRFSEPLFEYSTTTSRKFRFFGEALPSVGSASLRVMAWYFTF